MRERSRSQRAGWRSIGHLLSVLLLFGSGCIETSGETTEDSGADTKLLLDAAPDLRVGDMEIDENRADRSLQDIQLPDLRPRPDRFIGVEVESCEQACGRYESCGRLEEFFGEAQICIEHCERLEEMERPREWFSCLAVESCNLLHLCPRPRLPLLECEQICERSEGCELPLTEESCLSECAEGGEDFQRCGEALIGQCDAQSFWNCLQEELHPACGTYCERALACNLVRDDCPVECILNLNDPDPLSALRAEERLRCPIQVPEEDCRALDACMFPQEEEIETYDPQLLCRYWNECNGPAFFGPCEELMMEFNEASLACIQEGLSNEIGCGDIFRVLNDCWEAQGPQGPSCFDLCEAGALCEEFSNQMECTRECEPSSSYWRALLPCGRAGSCEEMSSCLEQRHPENQCQRHCEALVACELAPETCVEGCAEDWDALRAQNHRSCVAEAGGCEAILACQPQEPIGCDLYCEEWSLCMGDEAECAQSCDDFQLQNPSHFLERLSCHLRSRCEGEPHIGECEWNNREGWPCLNYCRLELGCPEELGEEMPSCLQECARGLSGDEGLRFLMGEERCLYQQPDVPCDELESCMPPVDPDCESYCGTLEACGRGFEGCLEICAQDPLARRKALDLPGCQEQPDDCQKIAECFDVQLPELRFSGFGPAGVAQGDLCELMLDCWDNIISCDDLEQELEFLELESPGITACMEEELRSGCPPDPRMLYEFCWEGGGPQGPHPLAQACEVLCFDRQICGEAELRECMQSCTSAHPEDVNTLRRQFPELRCAEAESCAELEFCHAESSPASQCERHCEALGACELAEEDCLERCDSGFALLREQAWRACVVGADGACQAMAACVLEEPPCDPYCERLLSCDLEPGDCRLACSDEDFLDSNFAPRMACVLAVEECTAEAPMLGVSSCLEQELPGGLDCLNFCRARTECVEGDMGACLQGCARGFGGEESLLLAEASPCLNALGVEAECDALTACLPEVPQIFCAAQCEILMACQIPVEACQESCEGDLERAACLEDARRHGDCGAQAACVGYEPERASLRCQRLCEQQRSCEPELDAWLCERGCTPDPPALLVQSSCAELSSCEDLQSCLALDEQLDPQCEAACEALELCPEAQGGLPCAERCTGIIQSPAALPDFGGRLLPCVEEADCDPERGTECFLPSLCRLVDYPLMIGPEGGVLEINTQGLENNYEARCGGQGPEQPVIFRLDRPAQVLFRMGNSDYDTLIFLRTECDDPMTELACNDDGPDGLDSYIDIHLEPGNYILFVDGYGGGSGTTQLSVQVN